MVIKKVTNKLSLKYYFGVNPNNFVGILVREAFNRK